MSLAPLNLWTGELLSVVTATRKKALQLQFMEKGCAVRTFVGDTVSESQGTERPTFNPVYFSFAYGRVFPS